MPRTITVQIPDEALAQSLAECAAGEELTVTLTVNSNDGTVISGTASEVEKGEGYEEAPPPAAAPALPSKRSPRELVGSAMESRY